MLTDSQQLKKSTKYWYSCAFFKHSQGQLSKTYRLQSPIPVHAVTNGNSVEIYHWLDDGSKGSKIWHPNYYNFTTNTMGSNFFGNYVFDNEEDAWVAYKKGILSEVERIEDLCKLKVDNYKTLLREKKNK
jgi:hypothetical protein